MTEPFILYPTGMIGDVSMSSDGRGQSAPTLVPALPGSAFSERGVGRFNVSNLSGRQGAIDMWLTLGATGSLRSLIRLSNGTRELTIHLDANNRVNLTHQDNLAVLRADATAQFAAGVLGERMRLRYTWDSSQAIDSTKFAMLRKNGEKGTVGFATAAWDSFAPTFIEVGMAVGVTLDFNGTIERVQVGTQAVVV